MNDLVFVAYGAKYPYLLRQGGATKETYSFIGHTMIERLMDGKSLDLSKEGKLTERTICLV